MGNTLLCLCILLFSLLSCGADKSCAEILNLNATEITTFVNTLVTLIFTVDKMKCERQNDYVVFIDRNRTTLCVFTIANGICTSNSAMNSICFYESENGPLTLNKTVKKEDNGMWNWRVMNDSLAVLARTQIYFKIISPSRIITLTLDGKDESQIILGKKDVLLICSWINGDPPGTASLLLNNKLVNSSRSSGNISYQLSASPELSGAVIRCEADGSDKNISTVLFITENRPVFLNSSFKSFDVRPGKTFNFTFPLRIHKPEYLQCTLKKTKSFDVNIKVSSMNEYNCTVILCAAETCDSKLLIQQDISKTRTPSSLEEKCLCYFGGSPPDLSLIFAMHNDVTDLGSWRLTASNRDGTDHQDFFLLVTREDKDHGEGFSLITTLLLGTIPAVVVCCIFTYIMHVKKSRQKIVGPAEPTESRVASKSQHQRISDIDIINLLPIHKLDNPRDSGFLDFNSLTAQE